MSSQQEADGSQDLFCVTADLSEAKIQKCNKVL